MSPWSRGAVYLKYHNQPLSGNKAELVERITKHATGSDL